MRALVTGAAGFVGRHLVRDLLAEGGEVFAGSIEGECPAPELRGARWLALDVTSAASVAEAVRLAAPDRVFHLAGQSSVADSFADPLGTWDVNATGTLRLVSSLPEGARMLFVSSAEVYGEVPEAEQPIREDRPLAPCNPYAASKAAGEMAVVQAGLAHRAHAVVARSFNHTGPGQDARFALPSFARQVAAARAGAAGAVIRVGNLEARRDLLDVRDVVRAYRVLIERGGAGEAYNVCAGAARSMREVLEELVAVSGAEVRIEVDPAKLRPVDVHLLRGDGAKLGALGWAPEIPLRRTLADLLAHEARLLGAAEAAR